MLQVLGPCGAIKKQFLFGVIQLQKIIGHPVLNSIQSGQNRRHLWYLALAEHTVTYRPCSEGVGL